ncbi:hypothetical protein AWN90_17825 [Nocardia terpenica]|uniref:Uncharacterized protein n=1 Tax=Nocardia terpenica TaxID=455432 RepID=A0A164P8X9_9NOCA|nr:hypothetical protein AWN90_17825 [Nocardia terpenica]
MGYHHRGYGEDLVQVCAAGGQAGDDAQAAFRAVGVDGDAGACEAVASGVVAQGNAVAHSEIRVDVEAAVAHRVDHEIGDEPVGLLGEQRLADGRRAPGARRRRSPVFLGGGAEQFPVLGDDGG